MMNYISMEKQNKIKGDGKKNKYNNRHTCHRSSINGTKIESNPVMK